MDKITDEELRQEFAAIWDVINKILDKLPKIDNPYLPEDFEKNLRKKLGDNYKGG